MQEERDGVNQEADYCEVNGGKSLMSPPSPRQVFDDPSSYWAFFTQGSDDRFEGQHFDRKEAGRPGVTVTPAQHRNLREQIIETISAFANSNVEGGLLVLGISPGGIVSGIDHLSEDQRNSLMDFATFLHHQAAEARFYHYAEDPSNSKTICLIFVPYTTNGICETPGRNPRAWIRSGPQNIPMTQDMRDQIRITKGLVDFEGAFCCPFNVDDVAEDVLTEFRKVFHPNSIGDFSVQRLLYEVGAIIQHNGEYWFTYAGLLFFGSNPQRVLPHSYIRLLRFSVASDQFNTRGLPTFDQKFTGPLTKQIRDARTFFRESAFFKRYQKRKPEGGFIDEPEFPPTVIDEAIVNAVAHRDYRTSIPIECELYTDAFIVKNPGRILQRNKDLPNEFSLSDTILNSKPRNPKLLEWLKLMKDPDGVAYVQAISEGTKHMLKEMTNLGLPAPWYRLAENETLIKLESKAEEREAAILAANQVKSTEFGNLFLLRIRQGEKPVNRDAFDVRYREFMTTFKDVLVARGWFIDRFGFSRIVAHRRGAELDVPANVKAVLRFYPAYEFQIREYFKRFYMCIDYKCQVRNVQKLAVLAKQLPYDTLVNRRCIAKRGGWREGQIMSFDSEFAKVFFFDTGTEEQLTTDSVIPSCSLSMLHESLRQVGVQFDLPGAIKTHSLTSKSGASRERCEKIMAMVQHVAETLFPIQFGDMEVSLTTKPIKLVEQGPTTEKSFPVRRLSEPTVEFREHHFSPDIRIGITQYGTYDDDPHSLEIVPVCIHSLRRNMEQLIERLKTGKYKYRGAERTFATRFSYNGVVTVDRIEDTRPEIERLLEEHPDWQGDSNLKRVFLIHCPEQGYSLDDHTSPYYIVKRLLLERGVPCQMVDTPTLHNPDLKDLNLALNITAKCGVTPWVLPDAIPDADFFVGLSYTQSKDGQRIMGFANVFNSYGKWEFYSGNTSYFNFEERTQHLARLVEETLEKLRNQLSPTPRIIFHYSAKLANVDRNSILEAARKVRPQGVFTFVWINSHHNVRFYDNRPETDGSLRRGSYVQVADNKIYLSTTGYSPFRRPLGTPMPLEVSAWVRRPKALPRTDPDLRVLAVQVLNLTKLNWASTDPFCGEPITLKYAGNIAYLTAAFLRQSEPFRLHPILEKTPWFI
ncbi:MAG: putative DNA binding domain-containing protein [Bacillota bacterium]|nr:putative DNA binding domain-containing protein [Bacillota bacterium]